MQDELSYPLSAQSLPVPLYVVLEGRIVYANAAGVCMLHAASADQLLGEPFSRFFQDVPAWLAAADADHADPAMPEGPQVPQAQLRVGRDSCISRQNDPKAMIQKGISDQDRILRRHAARIRIRSPSASASPITGQERY